jgi:signal transduction histidine kinase
MRSGRPERTENWETDARLSDWNPAMVRREGLVAMMAVPITIDGRVEGLLYVDNRTARSFTERDEAVVVQLAEHAAIAIKNARLFGAVEAGGRRLQALSARLLEVQEEERRHLSRELHDEIGQALTALKINLQMIKRQVGPVPATSRLDDSLGVVDRILQGVRRMSLDLRPSLLDDLGLAPAVRWYVTSQAERAALDAEVTIDGVEGADVPGPLATTCFRIVQEALTNALRHASPTRLTVTLRREEAGLRLAVRDDGVGFDVTGARRRALAGASMGLLGLTERAELAGGRAVIESAPGQGTTVTVWLPLGPREPRDEADSPP